MNTDKNALVLSVCIRVHPWPIMSCLDPKQSPSRFREAWFTVLDTD
jgi:hypothetical protein